MKRIERPPVMDSSTRYHEGETYRMLVQEMDAQGRFCTVVRKVRLIRSICTSRCLTWECIKKALATGSWTGS